MKESTLGTILVSLYYYYQYSTLQLIKRISGRNRQHVCQLRPFLLACFLELAFSDVVITIITTSPYSSKLKYFLFKILLSQAAACDGTRITTTEDGQRIAPFPFIRIQINKQFYPINLLAKLFCKLCCYSYFISLLTVDG